MILEYNPAFYSYIVKITLLKEFTMSLTIYDVSKTEQILITDEAYHSEDVLFFTGTSSHCQIVLDTSIPCTLILYNLYLDLSKHKNKCPLYIKRSPSCTITYLGSTLLISGDNTSAIKLGESIKTLVLNSPSADHSLSLKSTGTASGIIQHIPNATSSTLPLTVLFQGGTTHITSSSAPGIGIYYSRKNVRQPVTSLALTITAGHLCVETDDSPSIGYVNGELTESTLSICIINGKLQVHSEKGPAISSATKTQCNILIAEDGILSATTKATDSPSVDGILQDHSKVPRELSGTIFIEEHSPGCGDTLHGILSDITPLDATFERQWVRVPIDLSLQQEVIVGDSEEYTVTAEDIGYLINYRLVGTGVFTGTIEAHVGPIPKQEGKKAPCRPVLLAKTQTTLQIEETVGEEYAIRQASVDSLHIQAYHRQRHIDTAYSAWQTSGLFTDLLPDSQYQIIARCQFNPYIEEPSETCRPFYASTLRLPFLAKPSRNIIYGLHKVYFTNEEIHFRAQGTGVNIESPIEGDTRYIPLSYTLQKEVLWEEEPYIATLSIDVPGEYTLQVSFRKELYQKNHWIDTKERNIQTKNFTVTLGE